MNATKKNLTKLQFIMELPAILEQCVLDEQYQLAVDYFQKAGQILAVVGNVTSFQG